MARVLIVGCGGRGQALARALRARGHAVRGTTRDPARLAAIEAAGAEGRLADPDRIATLTGALDGVTIVCWLLGSARGPADRLEALHGPRLAMLLARTVDTPVRGVVYEAAGSVPAPLLAAGAAIVAERCAQARIPHALLAADPGDRSGWVEAAVGCVERLLAAA